MGVYVAGQCTWYVNQVAPWIASAPTLGNAYQWASAWRVLGGQVSGTPVVGAVACFQPGADGASAPFGHVGIVTSFGPNVVTISEMNGPAGPYNVDTRTVAWGPGIAVSFLLPPTNTESDDMAVALLRRDDNSGPDPDGLGSVYLAEGSRAPDGTFIPVRKRHILTPVDLDQYATHKMPVEIIPGYLLDRAEDGPPVVAGGYPAET